MKSKTSTAPPGATASTFSVFFGRRELAEYRDSPIPRYQGNPLIEALPPILPQSEISNALAYYPPYDKNHRTLPAEQRIHIIHTVLDVYIPLPEHIDLAERFSCLILEGYTARNPIVAEYWQTFRPRFDASGQEHGTRLRMRSSARGMTILGLSGGGKTTGTEACLNLYPQLIQHSQYHGRPFTWTQLVWLKLQCPFDGSTRGLCMNFFKAVDELIGTNHERNYAQGRRSTDELMPAMQRVAALNSLGVLVIDEIQHLDQSKSGGSERMLNFFTQLVNTIGVPVVFIGTPKAKAVLSREFRQSRRGTGEGDFVWDRLERGEKWDYFIESLWSYQYLRTETRPSQELFEVLYDESQGIIDIAIKLFMLSQVRAIHTGQEVLTPAIIRSVAGDSFRTIQQALDALRRGDHEALESFQDIKPVDYDAAVRRIANPARLMTLTAGRRPDAAAESQRQPVEAPPSQKSSVHPSPRQAAHKPGDSTGTLVDIVKQANENNLSPHDRLKAQGFVRDCADYLHESSNP
jgi:hypothetical protein